MIVSVFASGRAAAVVGVASEPAVVLPVDPVDPVAAVVVAVVVPDGSVSPTVPGATVASSSLPHAARNADIARAPPASRARREKPNVPGSIGGIVSSWRRRIGASESSIGSVPLVVVVLVETRVRASARMGGRRRSAAVTISCFPRGPPSPHRRCIASAASQQGLERTPIIVEVRDGGHVRNKAADITVGVPVEPSMITLTAAHTAR